MNKPGNKFITGLKYSSSIYFPKKSLLLFFGLVVLLFFVYEFNKTAFLRPQGIHQWRQTDCASIAMNYYEDGMDFFHPHIHNLGSDGSGRTISDFPLIYFTVAGIWKLTGFHEFIFRFLNLAIFLIGLGFLFKVLEDVFMDTFWALVLSLLLFTSPIVVYYSCNFLMNVPALGMILIAWSFVYKFLKKEKRIFLYLAALLFLLGGLLKITSLLSFMALFGTIFIEYIIQIFTKKRNTGLIGFRITDFIPFILVMTGQYIWFLYTTDYNSKFNSGIFLTGILPIWELEWDKIHSILTDVRILQWKNYFYPLTQFMAIISFALIFVLHRRFKRIILIFSGLMIFGTILFILLWFQVLRHHDYYVINLTLTIIVTIAIVLDLIRRNFPLWFNSYFLRAVFLIFIILNIIHAREFTNNRYVGWRNSHHIKYFKAFEEIESYNRSIGIERNDPVISIPDASINITLYLMDQRGWTNYYKKFQNEESFQEYIQKGAKYLFVNDSTLYKEDFIQAFISNKIGSYKNVDIYQLQ
jgi:hypothetical protein